MPAVTCRFGRSMQGPQGWPVSALPKGQQLTSQGKIIRLRMGSPRILWTSSCLARLQRRRHSLKAATIPVICNVNLSAVALETVGGGSRRNRWWA